MKKIFSEKGRGRRGWGSWGGFIAALLFATYTWGGFLWMPEVLRGDIQTAALATLHREVSIGEIRFNPFTLTAHLHDVKVTGSDGKPVLSVGKLNADLELASLWRRGVVVRKMVLTEPHLRMVVAADGSVDAITVLRDLTLPGAQRELASQAALPRLSIGSLSLTKAIVDLIDRRAGRSAKVELSPLDFSLEDFRTEAGHSSSYRLALHTSATEQLTANGRLTLQPLRLTGTLTARALTASTIDHLLGRVLPVRVAAGSFDFVGSYRLALQPQLRWQLDVPQIMARAVTVNERNSESTAPLQAVRAEAKGVELEWPLRQLHVDKLMMLQARLNVLRDAGGSINWVRWVEPALGASADRMAAAGGAPAWKLAIKTVDLQQATIAVDDELAMSTAHFELTPAHILIGGLSNAADAKATLHIATQLNRAGNITLAGELGVMPWFSALNVEAAQLPLAVLQPYVDEIATLTLEDGKFGLTGKLTKQSAEKVSGWRFSGRARLDGLRVRQDERDVLAWQSVAADGIDWRAPRLRIERLLAQQPSARLIVDKHGRLNLTRWWRSHVATTATSAARNGDPLLQLALEAASDAGTVVHAAAAAPVRTYVQFGRIDVVDGMADVTDTSIAPAFSTTLTSVSGSMTGVSSEPEAHSKLRFNARIDAQAPLSLAGEMSMRAPARFMGVTLSCRDLPVSKLDTYAAKFAGYHLAKGKLAMEVTYRVVDGKVSANHHVVLQDFGLGAPTSTPKADSLPAAVALSLLKNRDGNIVLDLPVNSQLDRQELRFPAAAWRAFAQVVNDATTAPFKTLGSSAGDGEDLAYVEFAPGSAEIPRSEQAKIDRLASALKERPEVRLEIPFAVAQQDDAVAVSWTQLTARVPQVVQDVSALDERAKKQLVRLLEQQHQKDVGRAAPVAEVVAGKVDLEARISQLKQLLLEAYTPSSTQLSSLGRARAQAVESALVATTGLQSGRVVIAGDRRARVAAGRVRLALGLSAANVPGP